MKNLVQSIVAITVAIVVFTAVLIPILGDAVDQTIDGEAHTAENTAPTTYLDTYTGTEAITITYVSATPAVTVSLTGLTVVATPTKLVTIDGTTITVTDTAGTRTITEDATITVPASGTVLVCTSTTTSGTATHGIYTSFATPVYVEDYRSLIVTDTASPFIASENVNGTAIPITADPYADHDGIYGITSVGTGGKLIATLEYTWHDQIPVFDNTLKTILDIIPILLIVGILMACVYLFFGRTDF